MAGKRREQRIEPVFGEDGPQDGALRVSLEDRVVNGRERGRRRLAPPVDPEPDPSAPRRTAAMTAVVRRRPSVARDAGVAIEAAEEEEMAKRSSRSRKATRTGKGEGSAGRRSKPARGFGLGRLVYWLLVAGLWSGIAATGVLGYVVLTMPPIDDWAIPARPPNVRILDADGRLIANRGDTGGEAVRLEQLPPVVPQAVIAIEDRRFYWHFGVDPVGLARAMMVNLTSGDLVQGGSTLTQQLAKNLFLEPDRTLERKLQEAVLALWLEWRFSKDEILEMYLNRVYLGAGAYGVDGAARRYFGKSARDLALPEAAVLAGLLKAPSRYAPTRDPELAYARAETVLAAMQEAGYITAEERRIAAATPLGVMAERSGRAENYVADWVMDLLPGYVASVTGDVLVRTTIDVTMQRAAEAALRETLNKEGAAHKVSQGALVAIDNDGAVKALVGGRDYAASQFNRAVQARRQPGSAFKPFVFLAAVERGYGPDSVVVDEPISIKGWQPKNYEGRYLGPVTLETALARSINTVAARLAAEIGPTRVAETSRRLGITSALHDSPSIALGTAEVTPLEITSAYVPFANGGFGVIPYLIDSIATEDGKTLFAKQGSGPGRVVGEEAVGTMNRMMQAVVAGGTGQKAILPGRAVAGKTGTSQDFRDAWFIGYVNGLTAGVWLGNDDNAPTRKATGGSLTAVVWNRFMTAATEAIPNRPLPGTAQAPPVAMPQTTPYAATDGLPMQGPALPGTGDPRPPADIPVAGAPTASERNLLERLFGAP